MVSVVPSRVFTVTVFGPVTRASPYTSSTPLPLKRPRTPPVSFLTMPSFQSCSLFASMRGLSTRRPKVAPCLDLLEGVARRDDGLARHAAPVQAHAADLVLLDAEDLLLQLPEADGAGVAAGAAADHDRVVGLVGHGRCSSLVDRSAVRRRRCYRANSRRTLLAQVPGQLGVDVVEAATRAPGGGSFSTSSIAAAISAASSSSSAASLASVTRPRCTRCRRSRSSGSLLRPAVDLGAACGSASGRRSWSARPCGR